MKSKDLIPLIQPLVLPVSAIGIAYFWGKDILNFLGAQIAGKDIKKYKADVSLVSSPSSYVDVWNCITADKYISPEQYRKNLERIKQEKGF